jgi:[ribosomal protein S18]-alanine N-acetyltransferase
LSDDPVNKPDSSEKIRTDFLSDPFDSPSGEVVRLTMSKRLENLAPDPPLAFGYRLEPWTELVQPAFAAVLAVSFSDSVDLENYPRLASRDGCLSILKEISESPNYLASGSWLALFNKEPAGAILASRSPDGSTGLINIVAVAPRHRRNGIGSHLVSKTLWVFRDHRIQLALLRVNRNNRGALRFFRSIGLQAAESRTYL